MWMVFRTIVVLILELFFGYVFGVLICDRMIKWQEKPVGCMIIGFLAYQALFQVFALSVYRTTSILHHLSFIWAVVVVMLTVLGLILCRKSIINQLMRMQKCLYENRIVMLVMFLVVVVVCFFVSTNGVSDEDARYYIGLVNTTVSTDSIYQYNVYNGTMTDSFYLRRAFTTFEIHSAVLCQIFDVHALLMTRIMRACQNVLLTSGAVFLCGKELFRKEQNSEHKAGILVSLFLIMQPIFVETIYTPARFMIYRAYEGKSFAANVLVIFVLYCSIKAARVRKKRMVALLLLIVWGSIAISTSAMVIIPVEMFVVVTASYIALNRKKVKGAIV